MWEILIKETFIRKYIQQIGNENVLKYIKLTQLTQLHIYGLEDENNELIEGK